MSNCTTNRIGPWICAKSAPLTQCRRHSQDRHHVLLGHPVGHLARGKSPRLASGRVTRLAIFPAQWSIVYSKQVFFKLTEVDNVFFDAKNELGYILGDFFTKLSGHPGFRLLLSPHLSCFIFHSGKDGNKNVHFYP
jgi:hypothetical protein